MSKKKQSALLEILNSGNFDKITVLFNSKIAEKTIKVLGIGKFTSEIQVLNLLNDELKEVNIEKESDLRKCEAKAQSIIKLDAGENQAFEGTDDYLYIPSWEKGKIHALRTDKKINLELAHELFADRHIDLLPGNEFIPQPQENSDIPETLEVPKGTNRSSFTGSTSDIHQDRHDPHKWAMQHHRNRHMCGWATDGRFAIFLSDLHMSDEGIGDDFMIFHPDYEGGTGAAKTSIVASIIATGLAKAKSMGIPETEVDVVLVGDVVDVWELAGRHTALRHSAFFRMLKAVSDLGVNVFYLLGNHDFMAPNYGGYRITEYYVNDYLSIWAEHGHLSDSFNNDPSNMNSSGSIITQKMAQFETRMFAGFDASAKYPFRLIDNIKPLDGETMAWFILFQTERGLIRIPDFKGVWDRFKDRLTNFDRVQEAHSAGDVVEGFLIDLVGAILSPVTSFFDLADEVIQTIPGVQSVKSELDRFFSTLGIEGIMDFTNTNDRQIDKDNRDYALKRANGEYQNPQETKGKSFDFVVLGHTHIKRFEPRGHGALINTGCCIPLLYVSKIREGNGTWIRTSKGVNKRVYRYRMVPNFQDEVTFCWIYKQGAEKTAQMFSVDVQSATADKAAGRQTKATQLSPEKVQDWRRGMGLDY